MYKIKKWIIGHKKTSIAIGIATVLVIAIGSIVLTFNARQIVDSRKQVETAEVKQKEEQLAKKVEEAKKVLDEKVENLDKLSSEDKNQLETVKKQLAEAIEKKDESSIIKYQNEFKTALNTAKTNVEKVILEEKKKEEEKKQEEQKVEENKPAENRTVNNTPTPQPAKKVENNNSRAVSQPQENKPAPAPQPQPKATPEPEKPKERTIIGVVKGPKNSGKIFKTKLEALNYADKTIDTEAHTSKEAMKAFADKYGFTFKGSIGYWIMPIEYSDGTVEYTVEFK